MDNSNPATFFNKTGAARAAGYKAKSALNFGVIGWQNYNKLQDKIETWLDEVGLSELALKDKLRELMSAKQTHLIKARGGGVNEKELPPGCSLVATTGTLAYGKEGEEIHGDGDTIIRVDMEAIETQRRTLDMAIRMKGMNAPEKRKHSLDEDTVNFIMHIGKGK